MSTRLFDEFGLVDHCLIGGAGASLAIGLLDFSPKFLFIGLMTLSFGISLFGAYKRFKQRKQENSIG